MFYATIWSLLPPVVAIALALITKEVYSSLFLGIVVGAALVAGFAPVKTLDVIINDGFIAGVADAWNVGIFLFLILLGILVALMNRAGGSAAFGRWAEKHVHTRIGAMLATFLLGVLIFVDDYFNCLTVGSVMRPVTDGRRISRAKLAYLIDATAAPVCMIAPISSWAAAVSDTTIMASAGAQCDHLNHVSTQIPYVLTVAAISFVSYVIAGFVQNVYVCHAIGAALTVATLFVLRAVTSRRETADA